MESAMADGATGGEGGPGAPQTGDDAVLPFQLDALDVRGRVCRLDSTIDQILTQHAYPPSICGLVSEAALLTALIGQAMKQLGRFSLQLRGGAGAAVTLIATDYFAPETAGAPARMRAYANFDPERTPARLEAAHQLLGEGLFSLVLDYGYGEPYQGLAPLDPAGLSASAEAYFAQSDQIATRFKTASAAEARLDGAERWRAGGVMLQHLAPMGESVAPSDMAAAAGKYAADHDRRMMTPRDVAAMSEHAEEWARANILLDTAEEMELLGPFVSPETLLLRLFHEETPRVFSAQGLAFGCTCSREKVEAVLGGYSPDVLREMATEEGDITADCQFCGAHYRFSFEEAAQLGA